MTRPDIHPRHQFRLKSLLMAMTGVCTLLAVLSAFGMTPSQLLAGFLVLGGVGLITAGVVELGYYTIGWRF